MKALRSSKLIALILAVALCLGAVCTTAFASEEPASAEATQPKIISQNVKYGGNFSLMFAVDAASCSGSTVTLKVYNAAPTADLSPVWQKTVSSASEKTTVNGIESYVFTTPGVAAKDMDKNYFVVAESDGVASEVKKYSVAEYLYERLYGDRIAFAPDAIGKAQADLYKSVLEMGKNAQELLFNHDSDSTNDRTTFVTDLYYVTAASGFSGAHGLVNGKYKGILTDGSSSINVTAALDAEYTALDWNVKYIDKDGGITVARGVDLSAVKPDSHMIVTPGKVAKTPTPYNMDSVTSISTSYIKTGNTSNTVVSLGEYNGSKAALITLTNNGKYFEFYNGVTKAESGATKLIYDTDITFPVPAEGNIADGYARYRFQFIGKSINGSSCKATTLYVDVFENGTQRIYDTKNGYKSVASGTLNLRFEYYETVVNGEAKMKVDYYANGEYYGSVISDFAYTADGVTANGVNDISWVSIVPPTALNTEAPVYQDNLIMAKLAPVSGIADTMDDPGAHAIDGWTTVPSSFATGAGVSIVEENGDSKIKLDMSPSGNNETIYFLTQSVEEGADKFIFEAEITDCHPIRTKIWFYDTNDKLIYDFIINGAGGATAENNGIYWGGGLYPMNETFKIRFEITVKDGKIDFNLYVNDVLCPQPSSYGTKYDLTAAEDLISSISKVAFSDNEDSSSKPDGYIIFDNIKIEAIKTTK